MTKAKCGCYVAQHPGFPGWVVTASSFLCPARHKQGVFVAAEYAPDDPGPETRGE